MRLLFVYAIATARRSVAGAKGAACNQCGLPAIALAQPIGMLLVWAGLATKDHKSSATPPGHVDQSLHLLHSAIFYNYCALIPIGDPLEPHLRVGILRQLREQDH